MMNTAHLLSTSKQLAVWHFDLFFIFRISTFFGFLETAGVDRIGRIIGRYTNWIEKYGQPYKKTPKLVRTVERMRKYVSLNNYSRVPNCYKK